MALRSALTRVYPRFIPGYGPQYPGLNGVSPHSIPSRSRRSSLVLPDESDSMLFLLSTGRVTPLVVTHDLCLSPCTRCGRISRLTCKKFVFFSVYGGFLSYSHHNTLAVCVYSGSSSPTHSIRGGCKCWDKYAGLL
ncbi:hypothetical protein NQZ68_034705 [Dissostichus eleginoides]|nr:hypothetical protein NQZ68_034705 [Dissostichus eleginoides]